MSKWNKYRLKDFAIDKNGKPYLYASFNTYGLRGVQPQKKAVFFPSKILDGEYVIVPKDRVDELERDVDWKVKFPTALESIQTKEIDIVPKSVVEEIEGMPLETDKFSLLSQAIQVENDSVIFYQNLMEIFPEWREVLQDITNEELKHIGQLEALRNEQPQVGQKVEEGENEADAQMKGIAVEGADQMKGQMNYQGLGAKESYYVDNKVMSAFEDFEDEHVGKPAVSVDDLGWSKEDSTKFKSMLKDLGEIMTDTGKDSDESVSQVSPQKNLKLAKVPEGVGVANEDFYEDPEYYYNGDYDERSKYLLFDIENLGKEKEFAEILLNTNEVDPEDAIFVNEANYEAGDRVVTLGNANWIIKPDGEIIVEDFEVPDFVSLIEDNPALKDFLMRIGLVFYRDEDNLEDADESITKDERESKDPEAKEACACESKDNRLAAQLAMQITEAYGDEELDDAEYAIETAHADGDISDEDFSYLYGQINAKR